MARIRTIKPEMPGHPSVKKLSRDARLLFVWLITDADDQGRFVASPKRLAGQLYPEDEDVDGPQVEGWLVEIEAQGMIRRYVHNGARYGVITSWKDHQKISKPAPSRLPPPPGGSQGSPGDFREGPGEVADGDAGSRADLGPRTVDHGPTTAACEAVALAIIEGFGWAIEEVNQTGRDDAMRAAAEIIAMGATPASALERCRRWRVVFGVAPSIRAVPGKWAVLAPVASTHSGAPPASARRLALSDAEVRAMTPAIEREDWLSELRSRGGLTTTDVEDAAAEFDRIRNPPKPELRLAK